MGCGGQEARMENDKYIENLVRFEVLTAARKKTAIICVVAPYSLVQVYRRFIGLISHLMEAESTTETSVTFY
jgi:hypothetical protein